MPIVRSVEVISIVRGRFFVPPSASTGISHAGEEEGFIITMQVKTTRGDFDLTFKYAGLDQSLDDLRRKALAEAATLGTELHSEASSAARMNP